MEIVQHWAEHDFYSPDTVVLGIDMGIEGIGIAVRRGTELLYCKSLLVELPQAKALETRRQFRAARHARKNRRVRMNRLKKLFEEHHLPWVDEDAYSRSDPFLLRYRAIAGAHPLASKEALSLCIRSCVERRGYDYFAMCEKGGDTGNQEFPWGSEPKLSEARQWLDSAYIDAEMQEELHRLVSYLVKGNRELTAEEEEAWHQLVDQRAAQAEQCSILAMLKAYASAKKIYERKGRGFNYPRSHVKEHLKAILERHRHLIDDYDQFCDRLFMPCLTPVQKKQAIFHYNRKTPREAQAHYEKKVKRCPYCEWLGLPVERCGTRQDKEIRQWTLAEFVATRTWECMHGKLPMGRMLMPEAGVRALMSAIGEGSTRWMDIKKVWEKAMLPYKLVKGAWNDGQQKQLKDIVAPQGKNQSGRAGISRAAARYLWDAVTDHGTCYAPAEIEKKRKELNLYEKRQEIAAYGGIYPQAQLLLGTLRRSHGKSRAEFAVPGFLQRLFASPELAARLGGKTAPDYCVIECVRQAPANKAQKEEIEKEQASNRKKKLEWAKRYGKDRPTHADFLRMRLFEEQGGVRNPKEEKPARCPFTGKELGKDPFSPELELAHLYPDSRGGLYLAENLVLTSRQVNQAMGDRTPREAAKAGLEGWLTWEEMMAQSRMFGWGAMKRNLFAFEPEPTCTFPDFNNMTRTAQLAAELRRLAAIWMGIAGDPEAIRQRIGNPSGFYTAAARRGMLWEGYGKDRSNHLHHRMDAAVLSCIPPGPGINDVRYGGIFCTEVIHGRRTLLTLEGLPLPDFNKEWKSPASCPVLPWRGCDKYKSLGDSTFWRVDKQGETSQRTPLIVDEKMSAKEIYDRLVRMGIRQELRPSEKEIEEWRQSKVPDVQGEELAPEPLRLKNGMPIKSIWKFSSKGDLENSPLGWNGVITDKNQFHQLRRLDGVNDRLEIWLGWNSKKKRWEYHKRIIPTTAALAGIKRMGMPWRGRKGAPEFLLRLLDQKGFPDLKTLVCGSLPPHAVKLGHIRKGDCFLRQFKADPAALEKLRKKDRHYREEDHPSVLKTWGKVSAIQTNTQVEFTCLLYKERKKVTCRQAGELAEMLGFPKLADACAGQLGLSAPQ